MEWLDDAVKQFRDRLYGMDDVITLPRIEDCRVESGYDELKKKHFIVVTYDLIKIVEYYTDPVDSVARRVTMSNVVKTCKTRLAIALRKRQKDRPA